MCRNEYNFSSLYTVKVDDFLLQYMQREYVVLEVHLALGTDYRTLAAARLSMRELLEKPSGRVHLSSALTGTDAFPTRPTSSLPEQVSSQLGAGGDANGAGLTGVLGAVNFGMVEYWLHLKIPMDQALRLYRERTKALGYLSSNLRAENAAVEGAAQVAATGTVPPAALYLSFIHNPSSHHFCVVCIIYVQYILYGEGDENQTEATLHLTFIKKIILLASCSTYHYILTVFNFIVEPSRGTSICSKLT